jgi:hypothetical protein
VAGVLDDAARTSVAAKSDLGLQFLPVGMIAAPDGKIRSEIDPQYSAQLSRSARSVFSLVELG